MKLIDILVEELPKRGGWPIESNGCRQFPDGEVCFSNVGKKPDFYTECATDVDLVWRNTVTPHVSREQYEAALAAKNEGWIEWSGGECPVPGDIEVLIKCKSEGAWDYRHKQRADEVSWTHDDSMLDIIAYLLHKQKEVEQDKANLSERIVQDATPAWSGEGLPPVGIDVEYRFARVKYRVEFSRGKVIAYGSKNAFMEHWSSKNEFMQPLDKIEFRPIRSEADKKRDAACKVMEQEWKSTIGKSNNKGELSSVHEIIYDAIAAGKIPGVKLED